MRSFIGRTSKLAGATLARANCVTPRRRERAPGGGGIFAKNLLANARRSTYFGPSRWWNSEVAKRD
ncbi:hypothetical protein [Oleiharenicola sp. Vm1]|uniref:hypothetical protein n=1 Tax=Oleiharenicola sp. Vm1 TaxID=3398393 RepID=UPI0039F4E679